MAGLTGHGHNHSVRASATSGQWVPDVPTNISARPLRGASEEWRSTLPAPSRLLDRSPSLRSIRQADRGPAVRCVARGKGCGERWARALVRGVSGWLPHIVVRPTELCKPEKPNGDCHTAGMFRIPCYPVAPIDPAHDPADRRCAAAAGRRALWRALGSCSLTRLFRVFRHECG